MTGERNFKTKYLKQKIFSQKKIFIFKYLKKEKKLFRNIKTTYTFKREYFFIQRKRLHETNKFFSPIKIKYADFSLI